MEDFKQRLVKEREELSETRANAAKKRYSKREISLPNWMDEKEKMKLNQESKQLNDEEKKECEELASKLLGYKK